MDNPGSEPVDIFLSGVHVGFMSLLKNTGDLNNANIGWTDSLWPSCNTSVNLPLYPGAYQIDADNDGLADFLVAPIFSSPALDVNNVQFYRNIGGGNSCGYQYSGSDSFLVHTMLDFGTDSKGVFFDFNGDGLMDIVVGNYYYYNPVVEGTSQLALYQNVGTATHPAFREVSSDYANLSTYSAAGGLLGFNPAFGDLDGDGKKDMLVGDANGDLFFFRNGGDTVASFPSMTAALYDSINVGGDAAPFIYDVNGDSLPDLVIGRLDGGLSYYWNYGTRTNPMFSTDSVNSTFGNINVTLSTATVGNSQPFIMKDSVGNMLLFVGSDQGFIYEYMINPDSLRAGSFVQLDSNFLQYDAGMRATMQAYDLNGDGKMEYLVGNSLGGLQLFSETVWDSSVILTEKTVEPANNIAVYPNPANTYFNCAMSIKDNEQLYVELLDITGRKVIAPYQLESNRVVFASSNLSPGVYIVHVSDSKGSISGRVVVQH